MDSTLDQQDSAVAAPPASKPAAPAAKTAAKPPAVVVESRPDPPVNKIRRRIVWASVGFIYLLAIWWGGTHALRVWWGILLLAGLIALGVVALRRQTLTEFPTAPQLEPSPPPPGTAGAVELRGIPGRTYVMERTLDFVSWLPFATNTLSSNSIAVLDPEPGSRTRFYRALMLP